MKGIHAASYISIMFFFKLSKIKIVSSIALSTIKIGKAVFNTGRGSKSCEDNNQGKYKRPKLNSFLGSFDDPRVLISFLQFFRHCPSVGPRRTIILKRFLKGLDFEMCQ